MKIGITPLLVASNIPFAMAGKSGANGAGDCAMSRLIVDGEAATQNCRRVANACINDMRDAVLDFSQAALNVTRGSQSQLSVKDSDLLTKVDFFYHCRTSEFDLKRRLGEVESGELGQCEASAREIARSDAEIGFVHERFVHPLVEALPKEAGYSGRELISCSAKVKESYRVYNQAVDCLAKLVD